MLHQINRFYNIKSLIAAGLCLIMGISLFGCGTKGKTMFTVCQQELTYEETMVFGYAYGLEHNMNDRSQLEEPYDGEMTYAQYYKQQLKDEIVNTLLLYYEAKDNKIKLSGEERDALDEDMKAFNESFDKEFLKNAGIKSGDVKRVFEMKAYADSYIESLVSEMENEDTQERYVRVMQVTFLTAKLDADGRYALDADGNVEMLSASEIEEKKQQAEEFSTRAKEGEAVKDLLKEYDSSVTGNQKYMNYEDMPEAYRKAVDGLSVNQISKPIPFDYGYYVIQMLEQDGKDYAQAISAHDYATNFQQIKEKKLKNLYNTWIGNSTDYIEDKLWQKIDMSMFIK